jgi:type IV pilus assembly protein PilC
VISFAYYARDSKGNPKKGLVEAVNRNQAAQILKERGLVVISLKEKRENLLSLVRRRLLSRVGMTDLVNFTRQLATMINAGLVITDALTILKNQTENPNMMLVVDSVQRDIEGGKSFSESLSKNPRVFDPIYIALVRSGESAGVLDKILLRLADNLEKRKALASKIKGAMVYPAIIVSGMVLVATVMMIFVIPELLGLFQEFEATLPTSTLILMAVSNFMVRAWWIVLILIGAAVWVFRRYRKTKMGELKVDSLISSLPVIGKLRRSLMLSEFTRTFGLLIEGGVLVVESLNVARDSVGSAVYKKAITESARDVERGTALAVALARAEVFPPLLPQMISVGEETGKLDEVLLKIATYFEQEAEVLIRNLTTAIEPIIMILLGIGVTFLIVAVILPIYNLTSQF